MGGKDLVDVISEPFVSLACQSAIYGFMYSYRDFPSKVT